LKLILCTKFLVTLANNFIQPKPRECIMMTFSYVAKSFKAHEQKTEKSLNNRNPMA